MLVLSLLIFLTLSFGAGYAVHKTMHLRDLSRYPEPPALDTPEHVLNYIEACSIDQDNFSMNKLLKEFREFSGEFGINKQKQLSGKTIKDDRPDWHHSTKATLDPRDHWEMAFIDLKRETEPNARIDVVKHWMVDLENSFTYKEMEMILDLFDSSEDRATVRKIYASKKKTKVKKKNG